MSKNMVRRVIDLREMEMDIPDELKSEDVYDLLFLFSDEETMLEYLNENYNISSEKLSEDLHSLDKMREEYGKEYYLRSAKVDESIHVNELNDGSYILWETY